MAVTYTWDLEAYISGAWTSIKRDVEIRKTALECMRGITGNDILSRVAAPGSLTCSLDNGESNSGAKLGYYSPGHANMRANFGKDTLIRLKLTYSATTKYVWRGQIKDLEPTFGQFKERSSFLSATDYMQRTVTHKLKQIAVQQNQRPDQLISTVLGNMATAPVTTSLETGKFSFPFALSDEQDERNTAMNVLQKICQSALWYVFIKGDATNGETFTAESEETRAQRTSSATFTDTMTNLTRKGNTDNIVNRLIGVVHPVSYDSGADTLLYSLENEISLAPGQSQTITCSFRDPANESVRISGINVVTPLVADTHYRMSLYAGTTGNELNASLSITPTVGGNNVKLALQNTGGSYGYINLIDIYGDGIYYYSPIEIIRESGAADKSQTIDFYYLSDVQRAITFLQWLHERASYTGNTFDSIVYYADENSTLMTYAMTLDIGDRITVTETATGITGQYNINRVGFTIETTGALRVEYGLEPVVSTSTYFKLNSSLLNGAHVLSPF